MSAQTKSMINNNKLATAAPTNQPQLGGDADESKNEGDADSMDVDEVKGPSDVNPSSTFNRNHGGNLKKPISIPPLDIANENTNEPKISAAMRKEIDQMLDTKMAEIKHGFQQKIHNMHLDLIRNLCQQESQIENSLETIAAHNKQQKEAIK